MPSQRARSQELTYPLANILGPSPEAAHTPLDLTRIDADAEALVSSLLKTAQIPLGLSTAAIDAQNTA